MRLELSRMNLSQDGRLKSFWMPLELRSPLLRLAIAVLGDLSILIRNPLQVRQMAVRLVLLRPFPVVSSIGSLRMSVFPPERLSMTLRMASDSPLGISSITLGMRVTLPVQV